MKAAWYEKQGPAREVLVVGEMPDPIPAAGEVRIRISVSGINPGDIKKREDTFGVGMPYPRVIPHSDGAGRVDQLGGAVPCGVTEPSRIVRLAPLPNLPWYPLIRLLLCLKACRWNKALVLAFPVSRRTEPFMLQVL